MDLKYYLHDFYIDYAGLDLPKMFIPDLLNDTAADGYGRANQCEARLISGDGSYYFYAPITAWACNPGTEFWYSRYDTGSYFNAMGKHRRKGREDRRGLALCDARGHEQHNCHAL